jgi:tight adherence protein B
MLSQINPEFLLMGGVFLGVILLMEGLRQLLSRRETTGEARSRRMQMIASGQGLTERLELLTPQRKASPIPGWRELEALLSEAGMSVQPGLWLGGMGACCLLISGVASQFVAAPAVFPLAFAVSFGGPILVLLGIRDARRARLVEQLPDALDLMARSLRSGYPLSASIRTVAESMQDPIATEFGIVVDQISYGDELVVAMRKLSDRVPTEDFRYLAASVAIQHGTGGNLGRVLTLLSQVIRGRGMMRRKIKAMSAEGRISALILSCIPFLMVGLNSIITPEYYGGVVDDPMFLPLAGVALGLIVTNALVMAKLVSFKI